jgi:hypothetical protein
MNNFGSRRVQLRVHTKPFCEKGQAGRIKRLSLKHPWATGATDSVGVSVVKVPKSEKVANVQIHPVSSADLHVHVGRAGNRYL